MQTFPEKVYDVTNCGEAYGTSYLGICTRRTLELQSEEIVLKTRNCCVSSVQRRPYAQLNALEHRSVCFGLCNAINSDLAPMDDEGNGGIVPGCGCDAAYVQEIVREMNLRKEGRGKVAQMRQQKYMLERITQLAIKVPMLLKSLGVEYPPSDATLQRLFSGSAPEMRPLSEVISLEPLPEFGTNQYDVTHCCQSLACTSRLLELQPDEASITTRQSLSGSVMTSKVPYANIESVDAVSACCCLRVLTAGELTKPPGKPIDEAISPGCGCNGALVEQIRADLQARVEVRGNLGQIKQLEKMMAKFHDVAAELALILDKIGADTSFPPTQETMRNIYGSSGPDLSHASVVPHTKPSEDFQTKEYNVRNETANICCLLCTCGIAGCETYTLTLEPEQAVFRYSNRCDASVERKPYAQLGSVDENVCCCCIHTVNGLAPGCCGDPTAVKEIAEELQNRKVGRGNIAQLRNQENTMIKAMEADVRTDIFLHKKGIEYPPSQQTLQAVYGLAVPTLPPGGTHGETLHAGASEQMDTKNFSIVNACDQCCFCTSHTLELNDEEAIFRLKNCCVQATSREPYAQLGSVEPISGCMGLCSSVHTDQNQICPGLGCSHALVNEIATELQHRKVKRGNIAQIRMQENLILEIIKLGIKYDLILHKEGIQYPPAQEKMTALFGQGLGLGSTCDVRRDITFHLSLISNPSMVVSEKNGMPPFN
ncbi:unnamed protein product [Symbiodinium natans]|uniref:Uncharacterized protein n=1 Tax=Symbiodinium natans TaxID=878477 RepID=A0A812JCI6_9DINO|nr:unnamed protein product [Symbiodinium natans]